MRTPCPRQALKPPLFAKIVPHRSRPARFHNFALFWPAVWRKIFLELFFKAREQEVFMPKSQKPLPSPKQTRNPPPPKPPVITDYASL